jgi:hypothetical protein
MLLTWWLTPGPILRRWVNPCAINFGHNLKSLQFAAQSSARKDRDYHGVNPPQCHRYHGQPKSTLQVPFCCTVALPLFSKRLSMFLRSQGDFYYAFGSVMFQGDLTTASKIRLELRSFWTHIPLSFRMIWKVSLQNCTSRIPALFF